MKVDLFITGQYLENYGSHDWNGEGECPQYWKAKGSHEECVAEGVEHGSAEFYECIRKAEAMEISESNECYVWMAGGIEVYPAGASGNLRSAIAWNSDWDLNDAERETFRQWQAMFGKGRNRVSPTAAPVDAELEAPALLVAVRGMTAREVLRAGW